MKIILIALVISFALVFYATGNVIDSSSNSDSSSSAYSSATTHHIPEPTTILLIGIGHIIIAISKRM